MSLSAVFILVLVALVVAALCVQVFHEARRLRRERVALARPAKYAPSVHQRRALAQASYQADMTLSNYHALRATEDTLEQSGQELNREGAR